MTRCNVTRLVATLLPILLIWNTAPAGAADTRRRPGARPDSAAAPAPARAKAYTFDSRFYKVNANLADRALATDIAKHMDAVYAEYSSRMAGFRPNPNAAGGAGGRDQAAAEAELAVE